MRFIRREWGWHFTILSRKHFKIKLLRFKPLQSCSLQYHNYRSELWLFFKGRGNFVSTGGITRVEAGEIMLVHAKEMHQYTSGSIPTYVIEIQFGMKCIEEDIVRIEK